MTPQELQEIQLLFDQGMAIRAIARKLGRNVKTIRNALRRKPSKPQPGKLDPFREVIRQKVLADLSVDRILREIRETGYTGSRTILGDYIRSIRPPRKRRRKAFRRFETPPGKEAQCDWSPYRLVIAGRETVAHCFSLILCCSRRMFIAFFRNERLATLLFAHVEAFTYHQGVTSRIVYDNQTAVTLGRIKGQPIWNQTFHEFAKHYGFTPYAHKVAHKERSGKVERPFDYVFNDLLKDRKFDSWEDLNRQARLWLDTIANVRKHTTTGRLVHEAYAEEKPLLIALPSTPFATERRLVRKVHKDAYLQVDGSFYPAPDHLAGEYVTVRVYPTRVEILDRKGDIATAHPVPDHPRRVDADWHVSAPLEGPIPRTVLETRFLSYFPDAESFLEGLRRRMNLLTPIHLHQIHRLVNVYTPERVDAAIRRAQQYGNFNALAIKRILEKDHPDVVPQPPIAPSNPAALGALDDVETSTPQEYTFDSVEPTQGDCHEEEDRPW